MAFRRMTGLTGRSRASDARTKADALAALGGEGCAVCRIRLDTGKRWFFSYENDSRVDLGLRERLERSFGFCAPHTRQLLDSGAATSWLARWVFADVARSAVRALAAPAPPVPGACPACEATEQGERDAVVTLATGLNEPEVRELLLAGDGFCLTHGRAVLERTGPEAARVIAGMLDERLGKDPVTARDVLIGVDPDVVRRRRGRERLAEEVLAAEESARLARPLGDVDLVLDWPCCPLCAAAQRVEWRYLRWLVGLPAAEAGELRGAATLCTTHLADLTSSRVTTGDLAGVELTEDGLLASVGSVIEHVAGLWRTDLQTFLRKVVDSSSAGASRTAASDVGRWIRCHLCDLRDAAVERERRLLTLVAADPAYGERLGHAHGVCLRHGLAGELAPAWRRLLAARIGLLSYEVDEAERKAAWEARWEVRGTEMAVWRRAPYLLDGFVLGPVASGMPEGDGD
ncbi:hypothetical protein [Actinopolymorpha pittospori]